MPNYVRLCVDYLRREGIKFEQLKDYVLKITYTGDNLNSIPIILSFDEDGDPMISCRCWNIANFKNKEPAGILACNELNTKYRWVKYYIDKDSDVVAELDALIDEYSCGEFCLTLVRKMVNIIDDSYETFMKARWQS